MQFLSRSNLSSVLRLQICWGIFVSSFSDMSNSYRFGNLSTNSGHSTNLFFFRLTFRESFCSEPRDWGSTWSKFEDSYRLTRFEQLPIVSESEVSWLNFSDSIWRCLHFVKLQLKLLSLFLSIEIVLRESISKTCSSISVSKLLLASNIYNFCRFLSPPGKFEMELIEIFNDTKLIRCYNEEGNYLSLFPQRFSFLNAVSYPIRGGRLSRVLFLKFRSFKFLRSQID